VHSVGVKYFTSGHQHANVHTVKGLPALQENVETSILDRRRRSGIAGAGLSLCARFISHFNITNMVI